MRRLPLLALLVILAPPSLAAKRVTVEQLRQILTEQQAAHKADSDIAQQVGSVELTERLTGTALEALVAQSNPGAKTMLALDLLGDASSFLELPASELPTKAPPDVATQQAMMNAAVNFVAVTLKHLPDFLATRVTRSFDDKSLAVTHSGWSPQSDLHLAGTFSSEITYREGREILDNAPPGAKPKQIPSPAGLTSKGEFGPILSTILIDAQKGKIAWSHWEQTPAGLAAVFHYQVPKEASHYAVNFCCVRNSEDPRTYQPGSENTNSYHGTPAYHGTLSLDPASGAILRVTLESELKSSDPITRAEISVQYGSVEIGGKSYLCPIRSIAISLAQTHGGGDMSDRSILRINEASFTEYHRFGSTTRILPGAPRAER